MDGEPDYGGAQREHMFAVVSACPHSLALSVDDLFSPSLLPLPAPPAEAADISVPVPLATQQWSVIESDIGNSNADPSGDVIKYFALVSYDSGKALALLQGQQGSDEPWQLAMSDFDATSMSCHWAALPVDSAAPPAATEEQPQLLCLQAAANPELYLTAAEAVQGDAADSKRKAGLSARQWAGGSAQSWTFMPVSSSLDDEGEDAVDTAGPEVLTADGDLGAPATGVAPHVMQYPAAEHSHEEVVASRMVFLDDLAKLHTDLGSTLRIPQMAGKELDLHLLYREVTSRGGVAKVTNDRKWREVTEPFSFPPTATSASFVLRKFYINLLHHFEQVYYLRNTGAVVPLPDVAIFPKRKLKKDEGEEGGAQGTEAAVDPLYQIGQTVVGTIHSKCEFGYFVSVPVGGQSLPGILYHPPRMSGIPPAYMLNAFGLDSGQLMHRRRKKKKRRRRVHGLAQFGVNAPVVPKQNRTAYNYFFGEWRMKLKAELPDVPDKDISKMIGQQWMALSPEQRLPYQALAEQDRLRYVSEMRDYHLQVERLKVAQEAAAAPILGQGGLSAGNLPPGATFKQGEGPQGAAGAAAAAAGQGGLGLGDEEEDEEDDGEGEEEDDEVEGGPGLYHQGQDVMGQQGGSQHPSMMGITFGAQDFGMMDETGALVHASHYGLSEGLPPGLSMDETGQLHGLNNLGPPVLSQDPQPPPSAPAGAEGAPQGEAGVSAAGAQAGGSLEKAPGQEGMGLQGPTANSAGEGANQEAPHQGS